MSVLNIKPESQVFLCKYRIVNCIIIHNDIRLTMDPTNILSIEYINDYESSLFAMLKLTLRVDVRKRIYMLANKREIRCKLEIEKIGYDIDIEEPITSPESLFDLLFSIYFNDDDENTDTETLNKRLTTNVSENESMSESIDDENYYESQNLIDLYLFNPVLLKASRYTHNAIYTQSTLQDIIGHMLTVSKHNNVLMSRIENTELYKELLLPANPVYKNLIYLDQYLGLYKSGSVIYYDIDYLYILNTNGKLTAKYQNEWTETSFLIPSLDQSIPGNAMIRQPNEKIFYPTISEKDISIQKPSIMKNVQSGSKIKLITTDGTELTDLTAEDTSYIDNRNTGVTYIKEENKYTGSVLQSRMYENESIVYINGNNLDINAFKPNKRFHILFDDETKNTKYKGTYRLSYAYHVIRIESESFSSSSHRIRLKKVL